MKSKLKAILQIWQRKRGNAEDGEFGSDVLGSYTGVPEDKDDDHPVQDADDL